MMNIVNNQLGHKLPTAQTTFGYVTKIMRTRLGLAKSHTNFPFIHAHTFSGPQSLASAQPSQNTL